MGAARPTSEKQLLHLLSFFALNAEAAHDQLAEFVDENPVLLGEALALADLHHVMMRTFGHVPLPAAYAKLCASRVTRNRLVVRTIHRICLELERAGCPTLAIKSTDHWPDLGHDFDLFTTGDEAHVRRALTQQFAAELCPQSWGDRLARKWNFKIPGLETLVEIHVSRLGQTGELTEYGKHLLDRRRIVTFGDAPLPVPSVEDQIILSALQRLYRHFFFRICDFVDAASVVGDGFDYERLRAISKQCGLWSGVATHLRIVSEYVGHYRGAAPPLPAFVRKAAKFGVERIYPHAGYLRLPLFPHGAKLYGHQVVKTIKRGNHAGALRLGLLPPLAAAAGAAYRLSGKPQGVW